MRLLTAAMVLVLGAALGLAAAQSLQPLPKLEARVTDLTGTLTAAQQAELEQKLADFEARKGAQIAVLLVPTTSPETIEQYSIRVVDAWKLGRKRVDDGVLLLLAKNDRTVRIEVGYGLEGILPDATANRIIDQIMVPLLRQGQYFGAISAGTDQIMKVVDGEPLPPPDQRWQGSDRRSTGWIGMLPFLLIAVFIGASVLRNLFGHRAGSVATGIGTGLLVFILSQVVSVAIGAGIIGFLIALFSGFGGGGWTSGLGGWGGFGGFGGGGLGGGFGGGFGGGSGGGFSGGGGGFGGGGASGSW